MRIAVVIGFVVAVIGCGGEPGAGLDASTVDASTCEAGTFGAGCEACRVCGADEYELTACLPAADRTCAALPALTGLTVSAGVLEPALAPGVVAYASAVVLFTEAVTVTPTAGAGATITVNGAAVVSGAASAPIALGLGANPVTITVTSADGLGTRTYTVVVERAASALQQAYAKASNPGTNDQAGVSVALAGDTLAVGAPGEDSSATGIDGPDNNTGGDSGAVYVFVRTGATWTQQAYVKASTAGGDFGWSVALSGDTLVVGAPREDGVAADSGAAYVFTRSGTTWTQQAYVKASSPGASDFFGYAVAVSGDALAVGAFREDSVATGVGGDETSNLATDSGAVYAFARTGTAWAQQGYLKASNTGAGDQFGRSLALAGDTLVVGAWNEDGAATGVNGDATSNTAADSGAAYVFVRTGATWAQQAYVKASNTGAGDDFGWSVAVAGDTLAVGAPYEDGAATPNSGAVYVFTRAGTTWTEQAYLQAATTGAGDTFGWSVALAGDALAVGAPGEDSSATGVGGDATDEGAVDSGAVCVFGRAASTWAPRAYVKASNPGAGDAFGYGVALAGDTLAVGAWLEDGGAPGVNGDGTSDALANSGAAYVLR